MARSVKIAELKDHLSAHLREVQQGATNEVLDRNTPIARIVPIDDGREVLRVRRPITAWSALTLPEPLPGTDILAELAAERADRC